MICDACGKRHARFMVVSEQTAEHGRCLECMRNLVPCYVTGWATRTGACHNESAGHRFKMAMRAMRAMPEVVRSGRKMEPYS